MNQVVTLTPYRIGVAFRILPTEQMVPLQKRFVFIDEYTTNPIGTIGIAWRNTVEP